VNPTVNSIEAQLGWVDLLDPGDWNVYRRIIEEARAAGVRFAFGGAFATAAYTGDLRDTKDFDFYVEPRDREVMIAAATRAGLRDHYDRLSYDRRWIYRASAGNVLVDTIWAMANQRASVDERWLTLGPEVTIAGERLRAIPIEELIWSKLYVLQRERSDWGDVFNLIDARAVEIDWDRLIDRLGEDAALLSGALSVFGWLAPDRARTIAEPVWRRLGLATPEIDAESGAAPNRASLLDNRPWFRRHAR
jgi:hypothetical protein